ncbi:hypothetical protein CUMW_248470 [Citrus unshiu]|uniref:DUF4220 domain-containing protein n=1 Tax=Citrus unshiu TaxID=55188 RepID=A0A2H5QP84_CITUN|nr:hypothetical protein CUMW_248470 [Citrus unshiu]
MVNPIPESVKRVWDNWNIRGIILFSLFLQTILILFAPFRKSTANRLMIMLIWSAYLLADWAANFAVGLIGDTHRDNQASKPEKSDLLAFWAPFLLLHLGGPDTITAFALEDNELWIRHFFGFVFQAIAAVYIFLLSLPGNKLFIPTILTFAAGLIKYFERTCALYFASLDRFRDSMLQEPDPGLNYVEVIRSATGYIMRFLSFGSVVVALSFFHLNVEKHGFDNFDVRVTYILIFGAICLDTIALFMLVFSDRTFASLKKTDHESKSSGRKKSGMATALGWFFALKQPTWRPCPHKRGWKKSVYEIDTVTARRISLTRGDWIFEADSENVCNENFKSVRNDLKPYIAENAFDKSLLLWHIATELLYNTDEAVDNDKEFSRLLSDYMLYLLITQSGLMSAVAGIGKIRFRDTCAEAKRFFKSKNVTSDKNIKDACDEILSVNTFAEPAEVKGDRSKSLLFEATMLAKQLKKLDQKSKWKLISKMWVELSSYAASHCDARSHAQQLSKGGELITFVWLLMSHFGLGKQFQINNDQGRATLIVGK